MKKKTKRLLAQLGHKKLNKALRRGLMAAAATRAEASAKLFEE